MRRLSRDRSNKLKTIMLFAILFIGLGFAALSATLGINGTTRIGKIAYDVHFENVTISEGSMDALIPATINEDDNTKIDFSLLLTTPGEYYEFEADIVNSGTLNAYLANIEMLGITEESKRYLDINYEYTDGGIIKINDLLEAGATERIIVRVEFKYDITIADLPTENDILNLGLNMIYNQDNGSGVKKVNYLYNKILQDSQGIDNVASKYVTNSAGIDFGISSSDTNGKGLYLRAGTENDEYPIYYYRGGEDKDEDGVEDYLKNRVLFANFCWKIVRTTEKGGIKIIYDGYPNESNECKNTGDNTQISVDEKNIFPFNSNGDSLADAGYMQGTRYAGYTSWYDEEFIYGSDVIYDGENYKLVDYTENAKMVSDIKTKHYTCKSTEITCSTVYYVYNYAFHDTEVFAIELADGKKLEQVVNESFNNENDSSIKKAVDEWFKINLTNEMDNSKRDYQNYLEDAVWCNDRSIASGGYLKNDDITNSPAFGALGTRNFYSDNPLPALKDMDACPNQNDRFTKNDTEIWNGSLNYSVGLLTADEVFTAKGRFYDTSSYLYTGNFYWTMTPFSMGNQGSNSYGFSVESGGGISFYYVTYNVGVRPVIVLKHNISFVSGNGSITNPYVIE